MKELRRLTIGFLTLVLGLGLMSGSLETREAQAGRVDQIPEIRVQNLGNYRGQYLNVLYVIASRAVIALDGGVTVQQVRAMKQLPITADSLVLPAVEVEKAGIRSSYNMILFVISPQEGFSWINDNGRDYVGRLTTKNSQKSLVRTLDKYDVDSYVSRFGPSAVLDFPLN